jgi:hypothetical protein
MFRKIMAIVCVCGMLLSASSNANAAGCCGICGAENQGDCVTIQAVSKHGQFFLAIITSALAVAYAYLPHNNPYVLIARNTLSSAARWTASATNEFIFSPLGAGSAIALGTVTACSFKKEIQGFFGFSQPSSPAPSGSDGTLTSHNGDICSDPAHHHHSTSTPGGSPKHYFSIPLQLQP